MKIYGNLVLPENAWVENFKFEPLANLPAFSIGEYGSVKIVNGEIKVNNGTEWKTVQYSNTTSDPFVNTLGINWINPDLSFNPTNFNALVNVSGLNANHSLFDVITQLDTAITGVSNKSLNNLSDVSTGSPEQLDVLVFSGSGYTTANIDSVLTAANINTTNLKDVATTPYSTGDILVYTPDGKFKNRKLQYNYNNSAPSTSFTITHDLGVQYCSVTCIDYISNTLISPISIVFNSVTQLTITFLLPTPVRVILQAVNAI